MIQTINPYTGKIIAGYPEHNNADIDRIIEKTDKAFENWRRLSFSKRAVFTKKMGQLLRKSKEVYAELITSEMGKIISEAKAEIEKCVWLCDYYAENSENMLKPEFIESNAVKSYVRFDPVGTIYAIMPWNFPFWQVMRFAIPTIMAGNTVILKHAPNVMGCATAIENLFDESGFPDNIFRNLIIPVELSEKVIADSRIQGVTLTGSQRTGRIVAAQAGKYLKKSILELGGSDPYLVLNDAELKVSCRTGVTARMANAGQVCISAKRFIVEEGILNQFIEEQKFLLKNMVLGNPMKENTDMGPLARADLLENIEKQVNESVRIGAEIITGGHRLDSKSLFYAPTLITNVKKGMPVYDEETFGPLSVVIPAKNAEDAIRIANDTTYGLGASLWTQDLEKAEDIAANIEAGVVFINGMTKSDPRLPFGGTKRSGYGRELSHFGIKEFLNIKTVCIA